MTWQSAIVATAVVIFPLLYRTARGAFESFDETLADAAKTLGKSNTYIFWRIRMPACRQGILAGTVLAFARALGEYGATSMLAGNIPGRTGTISQKIAMVVQDGNYLAAGSWVIVVMIIAFAAVIAINLAFSRRK